jgi:tRNA(Ile)-lysidine synthase TilS/MesJ
MKRCTRCVLPETFPGIQFDAEGVCQYCRRIPDPERRAEQRHTVLARFEALVDETLAHPGYHGLMSWSGGKDSTYTLWLLRKVYGLRILAFTFDNGFISPAAMDNMRTVNEQLGVDHIIIKPRFDLMRELFAESMAPGVYPARALERASGICNTCMGLAKGLGVRLALEYEVPMLVYGWSPGQIPLASAFMPGNRRMLQAMAEASMAPLDKLSGGQVAVYFPDAALFERATRMPVNISPLAFIDYNEEREFEVVRSLGWRRPQDTDPNSSNCLLNNYANLLHVRQTGYHPYVMELAGLVREGCMTREEALTRLSKAPPGAAVALVAEKLGVAVPVVIEGQWLVNDTPLLS